MIDKYRETRKKWDKNNPDIVKESKAKYNAKNPILSFRPTPQLLIWLEEERLHNEQGSPETNSALLIRKLEKLMKIERDNF